MVGYLPLRDREQFVKKWAAKASSEPEVAEWLVKHVLSTPTLDAAAAGLEEAEVAGAKIDAIYVVPAGYRGVQKRPLRSGHLLLNPYVEAIVPVDVRSHPVVFNDIEFPSRDGFTIGPHVLVGYKVVPEMAPELFVMLCENGVLYQKDAARGPAKNPILQKVVLPLIRGYVAHRGEQVRRPRLRQQHEEENAARTRGRQPARAAAGGADGEGPAGVRAAGGVID